jgi:hypothetical protein
MRGEMSVGMPSASTLGHSVFGHRPQLLHLQSQYVNTKKRCPLLNSGAQT